jgi:hypothetical protein
MVFCCAEVAEGWLFVLPITRWIGLVAQHSGRFSTATFVYGCSRPDAATPDNRDERLNQALADH